MKQYFLLLILLVTIASVASQSACPNNCSKRGKCVNGQCQCYGYFGTADCSKYVCKKDCSNNGQCKSLGSRGSFCKCTSPWAGAACDYQKKSCPDNCSGNNGWCCPRYGRCKCKSGFTGANCAQKTSSGTTGSPSNSGCPNNCGGYYSGKCKNNKCKCIRWFGGSDCSKYECKLGCSGSNGVCTSLGSRGSYCKCKSGFYGYGCENEMKKCPDNCSGHGRCCPKYGRCKCNDGWFGENCGTQRKQCPNNCSGNGQCNTSTGQCTCNALYEGPNCSTKKTSSGSGGSTGKTGGSGDEPTKQPTSVCKSDQDCSNQGNCNEGKCVCYSGAEGAKCEKRQDECDCVEDETLRWISSEKYKLVWCECQLNN